MLGLLTCKRLLSQQWGGSTVPVVLVALEETVAKGCQHQTVAEVWCNDAMYRLARGGQAGRPLVQQLFESNPLLAACVHDQLGRLAKGDEAGAPQTVQGRINCHGAFSYASLYVVIIPCFLEASDFGHKAPLASDGKTGYRRLAWLPTCFCGASPSDSTRNSAYTYSKEVRSVPALLLQFSSSAPSDLLCAAPSAPSPLLRQRSMLIQPTISPSRLMRSRSANIALKSPHDHHLSLPLTPGASSSNGMQPVALPMPATHAVHGLTVHPSHATGLSVGPFRPSIGFRTAISSNAASERGRGSWIGGVGISAAARSEAAGGRTLRERRNSLALAAVPLAVTIFALPSGAVLHQNAASMDYYGDRTSITPPSRAPPGAAIPPRSARHNNSMPALQALLESASSGGRQTCAFGGDGDGDGGGDGRSRTAAVGPAGPEAGIADEATLAVPGSGEGGGAAGLHVAAASGGDREPAAGSESQVNVAFLSTSGNVHLVLPAGGSHASAVQGYPPVQAGAATTATAAVAAGGRLASDNLRPGALASCKAGHVGGDDGGVAVFTGPEFDVLRQLFALDPTKLDRMLAAVAAEGEVWQGIVRVPYSLDEESAQEDDDEGKRDEEDGDEAQEVEASGGGPCAFAARPYRPGEARPSGRAQPRGADPDSDASDEPNGDNLDIMASIPIDVQEAMSLVTAGLNQRIRTGIHAAAALTSTAGLCPSAVAVTSTQSAVSSEARGREAAGSADGRPLRRSDSRQCELEQQEQDGEEAGGAQQQQSEEERQPESGLPRSKEAGGRRLEGGDAPAASRLRQSRVGGDVGGTSTAGRTLKEGEEEPAASSERGQFLPSGASGAAGGPGGGDGGDARVGDGGACRLGPSTGDPTANGEMSKTEPDGPCAPEEIQTGGITPTTSLGAADSFVRRQYTGLCLTQEPDTCTGSNLERPQRPQPRRSASAFSLHFARLRGKSSSSNAHASGSNIHGSDRDMSVATGTYGREGSQGQSDLAWGFIDVRDVGAVKPYRAVTFSPAGALPRSASLQLAAAGDAGGGAGGGAGLQQPPQHHQQALQRQSPPSQQQQQQQQQQQPALFPPFMTQSQRSSGQQQQRLKPQSQTHAHEHAHAQGQRQGSHSSSHINVPVPSSGPQRSSRPTVGRILASLSRSLHLPATATTTATTVATVAPIPIMSSTSAGSSTFTGMMYGSLSPDDAVRQMSWVRNSIRSDGSQMEAVTAAAAAALAASTQASAEVGLSCSPQTAAVATALEARMSGGPKAPAASNGTSMADASNAEIPASLAVGGPGPAVAAAAVSDFLATAKSRVGAGVGAGTSAGTGREGAAGYSTSRRVTLSRCLSTDIAGSGAATTAACSVAFPTVPEESASGVPSSEGQLSRKPTSADLEVSATRPPGKEGSKAQKLGLLGRFLSYTVDNPLRRRGNTAAGTGRGKGEARAGAGGASESARSTGWAGRRPFVAPSPNQRTPDSFAVPSQAHGCRRQGGEFAPGAFLVLDDEAAIQRSAQSCLVTRRDAGGPPSYQYGRGGAGREPYGSLGGGSELGDVRGSSAQMPTTMAQASEFNPYGTMPSILTSPPQRKAVSRRQSLSQRRSFHTFNGLATSTWQVLMASNEADIYGYPQPGNEAGAAGGTAHSVRQSGSHDFAAPPPLSPFDRHASADTTPRQPSLQAVGSGLGGAQVNFEDVYGNVAADPSLPSSVAFHTEDEAARAATLSQFEEFHLQLVQPPSSTSGPASTGPSPCGGNPPGGVTAQTEKDGPPALLSPPQTACSSAGNGKAQDTAAGWGGQQQQQQQERPVVQRRASPSPSRDTAVAAAAPGVSEDDPEGLSLLGMFSTDDEDAVMAEGGEDMLGTLPEPSAGADRAETTLPRGSQQLQQQPPQPRPQYGNDNDGPQASQQAARRQTAVLSPVGGQVAGGCTEPLPATSGGALSWNGTEGGGAAAGQLPASCSVCFSGGMVSQVGAGPAAPAVVGSAVGATLGSAVAPAVVGSAVGAASQALGQPGQGQGQLPSSSTWTRPQSSRVLAFASSLRTAPQPLAGPPPPTMMLPPPQHQTLPSPTSATSHGMSSCSVATSGGLVSACRPRTQTGAQQAAMLTGLKGCRKSRSSLALGEMLHLQQQVPQQQQQQQQHRTDRSPFGFSASMAGLAHGGSATLVATSASTVPDLAAASAAAAVAAGEDPSAPPPPLQPAESTEASGAVAPAAAAAVAAPPGPRESLVSQQPSRMGSAFLRIGSSTLSKASWLTGPSPDMSSTAPSASALTPKGGLCGTPEPYGDGMGGDSTTEGPEVAAAAAAPGGAFAAAAAAAVAASPMLNVRSSLAEASDLQPPLQECWHEVCATSVIDPATGALALVLVQQDVTAKVVTERHVHHVAETEHRLLEQIFPRHVLQYITEESVLTPAVPSSVGALVGGTLSGSLTADGSPHQNPGPDNSWRPQIRDCNRLATWHAKVTVLFADIQGFTPMCKVLPPRVVMAFLNTLFTRFDAMLDYYRVYKVETIGDCYMVAGGLIREDEDGMAAVQGQVDPDQASNVFSFARAMLRAASCVRLPTTGLPVKVRVGIHTGPVVSGVVGTRMPRFCLFGDTVNTASRMESTGVPGAIHASEDTHCMLRNESGWVSTGGIEVKGKGLMRTYLWSPPAPPSSGGTTTTAATSSTVVPPPSPNLDPPLPPTRISAWSVTSDAAPFLSASVDTVATAAARASIVRQAEKAAARASVVRQAERAAAKAAEAEAVTPPGGGSGGNMPDASALMEQMEALVRSIAEDASAVRGGGDGASAVRGGGDGAVAAERRDGDAAQRVGGDATAGDLAPPTVAAAAVKPAAAGPVAPAPASAPARRWAPLEAIAESPKVALSTQDVLTIPPAAMAATVAAAKTATPGWEAAGERRPQQQQQQGARDDAASAPGSADKGGSGSAAAAAAATSSPEPDHDPEREPAVALDPSVVALSQLLNNVLLASRQRACSGASHSFSSSANQLVGVLDQRQSLVGRSSSAQLHLQMSPTRADQLPAGVGGSTPGNSSSILKECYASLKEWYHRASS